MVNDCIKQPHAEEVSKSLNKRIRRTREKEGVRVSAMGCDGIYVCIYIYIYILL